MPTKKKRVGFIPRDDVMKIIDKLSLENNLSISKIISILVEEALSNRGITDQEDLNKENTWLLKIQNQSAEDNTFKEKFNLKTYKRFLLFLEFQEMITKIDQ